MVRTKGKFYWTYHNFSSRNFSTLSQVKQNLKIAIKKNKSILGSNTVWFTKHILSDIEVGYYGASGKWWQVAYPSDLTRWKRTKTKGHPLDDEVWEPTSRSPYWNK